MLFDPFKNNERFFSGQGFKVFTGRAACAAAGFVFLMAGAPSLCAFEEELRFAEQLTEEGFPRLAQTVLRRTLQDSPEARSAAPPLQLRILIAKHRFEEAQDRLAALNNPASLQLFLAETAFRTRRFDVARSVYESFFSSVSVADDTVLQAAFHFGSLLEEQNEKEAARALYEKTLTLPPPALSRSEKNIPPRRRTAPEDSRKTRPLKVQLAQLLVSQEAPGEEALERAQKLCEEVQLGGLDLWFGRAVVAWGQVMEQREEWNELTEILETQLELLKQIEEALEKQGLPASSISPLAGARSLLGRCYEQAGKKAEALHQFYNVYAQYGDSKWGAEAQKRAAFLIQGFEKEGRTVRIDPGPNAALMEEGAFRIPRRLFSDRRYAEAVPAYLSSLCRHPESEESVTALRELTVCYIRLNHSLCAETIAAYLGERFSRRSSAADALLAAGKTALDEEQSTLAGWLYDRFFDSFPGDPRAPGVRLGLASVRRQAGDRPGEESHLNRILRDYPDSPQAVHALARLAWTAYEQNDYHSAVSRLALYLEKETETDRQIHARFALAESFRSLSLAAGDDSALLENALAQYRILEETLCRAADGYGVSDEQLERNRPFFEKGVFYQSVCLAGLRQTEDAVDSFERFAALFPESDFIPQARIAQGAALLELGRYENALTALAGFDENSGRLFLEPVLFYRGQAFLETGRSGEAAASLEQLLTRWPKSSFFFEAKLLQGRAWTAAGQKEEAIRVLSDVLRFASDPLLIHRAGLELGRAQDDPAEKLASFQRVALLADPSDPAQAKWIAAALLESLPIYLRLGRPQEVLTDGDRLLSEFPDWITPIEIAAFRATAEQLLSDHERHLGGSDDVLF